MPEVGDSSFGRGARALGTLEGHLERTLGWPPRSAVLDLSASRPAELAPHFLRGVFDVSHALVQVAPEPAPLLAPLLSPPPAGVAA
jgi:hypothetical protein